MTANDGSRGGSNDGSLGPAITPPAYQLPEGAAAEFDAGAVARTLLRGSGAATLATLDPASGYPLATLVTYVPARDGSPLFFLSGLSLHTRNLKADPRVSLLIAASGKGDPLAHPRLTLVGRCLPDADPVSRSRFLARNPKAALYAELPDFALWRLNLEAVHLNGGFGRASRLTPEDILMNAEELAAFAAGEAGLLRQLQDECGAGLAAALGVPAGKIALLGVDRDGLDLAIDGRLRRLSFAARAGAVAEVVALLRRSLPEA